MNYDFESIDDIISKITDDIQCCTQFQLIQDIIMIYNKVYKNYNDYRNKINLSNQRIVEFDTINSNTTTYFYHPKHTIISEKTYIFIINLSKLYCKGGD